MDYNSYPVLHDLTNTYESYLANRRYLANIDEGILQVNDEAMHRLGSSSFEGSWQLTPEIQSSQEIDCFSKKRLKNGMHSLGADFNIAMGRAMLVFDMMSPSGRTAFENIIQGLQKAKRAEGENRMREALKFYRDGCKTLNDDDIMRDALRQFQMAVEKFAQNTVVYLHLGHIYHFSKTFRDFKRALDCYNQALTVGLNKPELQGLTALSAFYGGWIAAAVFGDIQVGLELTRKAVDLEPAFSEGYFHLAKMHNAFGNHSDSIKALRLAVGFDRNYLIKIELDSDFRAVREELRGLLFEVAERDVVITEELFDEKKSEISEQLKKQIAEQLDTAKTLIDTTDQSTHREIILKLNALRIIINNEQKNQREEAAEEEERQRTEEQQREQEEKAKQEQQQLSMQEELKARIEAEMQARIKARTEKERRKNVLKSIITDFIILFLCVAIGSFFVFGLNFITFLLALFSCIGIMFVVLV